jgi:hypothetical protein
MRKGAYVADDDDAAVDAADENAIVAEFVVD